MTPRKFATPRDLAMLEVLAEGWVRKIDLLKKLQVRHPGLMGQAWPARSFATALSGMVKAGIVERKEVPGFRHRNGTTAFVFRKKPQESP